MQGSFVRISLLAISDGQDAVNRLQRRGCFTRIRTAMLRYTYFFTYGYGMTRDILIIGGGINGYAVAREAALHVTCPPLVPRS